MKKGIFTILLVIVGVAGVYSISEIVDGRSPIKVNVDKKIEEIIEKRRQIPYRVGSLFGLNVGSTGYGDWLVTEKNNNEVTGEFSETILKVIKIPTKSEIKKEKSSYDGESFDYGKITTKIKFNQARALDESFSDLAKLLAKSDISAVEETFIKKNGDVVSILNINTTKASNDEESLNFKGFNKIAKGSLAQGYFSNVNFDFKGLTYKDDDFGVSVNPLKGKMDRTENQFKQTTEATQVTIDTEDDSIAIELSPSESNIDVTGYIASGVSRGSSEAKIKEVKVSINQQERVKLNDFVIRSEMDKVSDKNIYRLKSELESQIKISGFGNLLSDFSDKTGIAGSDGAYDIDTSLDITNLKLLGEIKNIPEKVLVSVFNLETIDLESFDKETLETRIKEIFSSLKRVDSSLNVSALLGTNKGNISLNTLVSLSELGKSADVEALFSALEESNETMLSYFNAEMDLSVNQEVIDALGIGKSQLAFLAAMGFVAYKEGSLSAKLILKDGKIIINGNEIPPLF